MMIRTLSRAALPTAVLLIAAVLTASCAVPQPATSWQKTGAGDEARRTDAAACRAMANREVDRDYERRGDFGQGDAFGGQSTWQSNMAAYDARKSQTALFEQCMQAAGYQKVRVSRP